MRTFFILVAAVFVLSLVQADDAPSAPVPPKTFTPTEQIDPDSAVSFPVDI